MPAAPQGLQDLDVTIAQMHKSVGYATGHFGKNHLGDRNEFLPTVHGFDEFYGNLYYLNAEEEPEHEDYPKPEDFPDFRKNFGPMGVLHCYAADKEDEQDLKFGIVLDFGFFNFKLKQEYIKSLSFLRKGFFQLLTFNPPCRVNF